MNGLAKIKEPKKARIGIYSAGLHTYWEQFEGLFDCLMGYNNFIAQRLAEFGEVYNFGMVDTEDKGREAKVRFGAVTTLGVTQTGDGKLKFNISEGEAVDAPILLNGNTSTHIRFAEKPAEYMDKWFVQAPAHHLTLSVGHNTGLFKKAAELMDIPYAVF